MFLNLDGGRFLFQVVCICICISISIYIYIYIYLYIYIYIYIYIYEIILKNSFKILFHLQRFRASPFFKVVIQKSVIHLNIN